MEFSNRARLTVPFTTDTAHVRDRLQHAEPHGKTALLDAVDLAVDSMKRARYTRRALLILSDGGDNDSRYTRTEILNRVREADLWIYAIGIYGHHTAILPEETRPARELLEALSEESGGRHYAVESPADLPGSYPPNRHRTTQPVPARLPPRPTPTRRQISPRASKNGRHPPPDRLQPPWLLRASSVA